MDENERYYPDLASWIRRHAGAEFVSSAISVMEYLACPYREGDEAAVRDFYHFVSEYEIVILPIDERTANMAAKIRAKYKGFKAMDALQLATAMISDCDLFLTNDKQLRRFDGLPILVVDDLSP